MRQKLLLADDSITVQRVIELTFADEGLDIVTVGDGAQAIEHLRRDRADIVLADLNMPHVDGYAVAEHVKRTPDLVAQTRVVLLTGAFEPVDRERAQKIGVDGILAKPFEPQVAIELVRQLLAQPPLSPPRTVAAAVAAVATSSDWAADVSARPGGPGGKTGATGAANTGATNTGATNTGVEAAKTDADAAKAGEGRPLVATGYPFEPGSTAAKSTPAELDDYFKRLDEALASAGLKASPAVRDMLAESKDSANAAAEEGAKSATASAAAGSGTETRESSARGVHLGRPVGEERQMSGVPPRGPGKVTLVDAFSALLAAEQGDGSAEASLTAWESEADASEAVSDRDSDRYTGASVSSSRVDVDSVGAGETAAASSAAVGVTPVTAAAAPAAPVVSEAQLEAVVRKVVGEMADRILREINAQVLDVSERLVREEIERLKAAAEAEQN